MILTRLSAALPWALLLYVAAAFVLPTEPASALVFYVAILPTLAACLITGPRPGWEGGALPLSFGLIAWSGCTLLWGTDDGHRSLKFLGATLATACFVLAAANGLRHAGQRRLMANTLVAFGAGNAVFSVALTLLTNPHAQRPGGWGITAHPILGAAVMSVAYLTALAQGLPHPLKNWDRLAAAAVMAVFIAMTESRGPILAAGVATVFLCAVGPWRWGLLALGAAAGAGWWALPARLQHHSTAVLVARGSSHRFEIWRYTAKLIEGRPLIGHGLAANLHLNVFDAGNGDETITFPHDLYLSLLFYSGLIGLGLFAALACLLTWRLWQGRGTAEFPWLAALWINLLLVGLTDLGQITKGPGTLTLTLWLPICLIAAAYPTRWRPVPS